jgi:nucleoside-diphosphate-sugar epimerase
MHPDRSATTVLVTGATGFIAMHCIVQLLEQGYRVRGTARSRDREAGLRRSLAEHVDPGDRLEIVEADLTHDDGWPEAVAGCRYVLHVASPIPRTPPKHEDDLIVPAREGALRVLRAAADAGVERVVMTSSMAAISYGVERRGRVFTEDDWSNPDSPKIPPYEKSKTLAERAAWDFVASLPEERRLELVTINPGLVLGPVLDADWGTSGEVVRKLMKREFPGCPNMSWAPVDVRDVAAAHVAAMTTPGAGGKRFLCAIEPHTMLEIAQVLERHFGERGYRIPTRKLPSFVVRIVALFDRTARLGLANLDDPIQVDNSRIESVLSWKPRPFEEMVRDMGESMIRYGVV